MFSVDSQIKDLCTRKSSVFTAFNDSLRQNKRLVSFRTNFSLSFALALPHCDSVSG